MQDVSTAGRGAHAVSPRGRRAARNGVAACAVLVACGAAGCAPGIAWRDYTFDRVYEASEREGKLTFVYFRHWAVVECTEFEERVLKQPNVRAATEGLNCVPLDVILDRNLAESWHVTTVPAVVILGPAKHVLAMREGKITAEQLLADIERARATAGMPQSAPAEKPAP